MNHLVARIAVVVAAVVMVAIRAPHGQRSRTVKVVTRKKGAVETALLTVAWIAFFAPLVWVASPWFAFADYALATAAFGAGVLAVAAGLWLFHRSHADLGVNWSITLEVRERHTLVTTGVYRSVRHPMYAALLLYALGHTLFVPNWIAGPSYLVAMVLLVALRLGPEEAMMVEAFGADYEAYSAKHI